MEIEQYSIVIVNLDPTVGSEIKKRRPCVVVSPAEMNRHLRTVVVIPMTTAKRLMPTRVKITHQDKQGFVAVDQIRTIDKSRIVKVVGVLKSKEILQLKNVINETFVL